MESKTRAQLRRLDPWEVRGAYAWAISMAEKLGLPAGSNLNHILPLAPLAALIREDDSAPLGVALRRAKVGERHVRRLLESSREDIVSQLEKAIRLLKRKANVTDVMATAIYWGPQARRRIATDYFGSEDEPTTSESAA